MKKNMWYRIKIFKDIIYEKKKGIAKITINREHVYNAFRPLTIIEIQTALNHAIDDIDIGVIILTGKGQKSFCSGGDQIIRGMKGYVDLEGKQRLNVLDLQRQMRSCPKPIIAMVNGFAIGGGHILHLMSDLTIASENAIFQQTGPKVGSFDGGFGSSYLARVVGQKKAREIWYLCKQYNAKEAIDMGLINKVVPLDKLEEETLLWCEDILKNSRIAIQCLKASLNADCDGQVGLQELAGCTTMLFYMSNEGKEGKNAFLKRRKPLFFKYLNKIDKKII